MIQIGEHKKSTYRVLGQPGKDLAPKERFLSTISDKVRSDIMRLVLYSIVLLMFWCNAFAIADDRLPPYKSIEIGVRSYLVVLDNISLTERRTYRYLITQENEPSNFANQVFGIYLENRDLSAEHILNVAEIIDRIVIDIRIFNVVTGGLLYNYHGPIFDFEKYNGLTLGGSYRLGNRGIHYSRYLSDLHYRLDFYYTIFGLETPFRKKTPQRIEFSVVEPMTRSNFFGGNVMLVLKGGIGK